ncbi:MAG TPA: ABC transporter family substrate-binding protein, partial [Egibacteraceae bacterium]|nr:ABC transporter family substrate-binding protein [Egibacteraceae bacterium]
MNMIRRPSRWLLILAVLAMAATACQPGEEPGAEDTPTDATTAPDDTGTPTDPGDAQEGGTVIFGLEQEPAILNNMLTAGNLFATAKVVTPVLYPLWRIRPDFSYEPLLLDGEPETRGGDGDEPFTVVYKLKDEAVWSDGTPISSEDVVFTLEVCLDEEVDITSRAGCDEVESTNIIDEKTVEFVFRRPYAPWRTIFSTLDGSILPAHALEGEDFNTVWNEEIVNPKTGEPIASGPFIFDSWEKGQQITLVRNENFWGQMAHLDTVVFRPIEDVNTLIQAFRGGEVDAMDPQPQIDLIEQIEEVEGAEYQVSTGPQWEHLDFNHEVPPLDQQFVRQAIGMGIDRATLAGQLIAPMDPAVETLNNVIYVTNQAEYQDNWSDVIAYDPEGAIALLEENGCTRGEGDIFECGGNRLEFGFVTTAGNELRELTFEVMQQQLQEIGVQLNADFGEPAVVFGERLPGQDYDMFLFAWVGSPDPAGGDT